MSSKFLLVGLSSSLLILSSCGKQVDIVTNVPEVQNDQSKITPADIAIAGKGGIHEWYKFVNTSTPDEVNDYLKQFEIKYLNKTNQIDSQAATGCPTRFGSIEYNTFQTVGRTQVWIDGYGRPYKASQEIVPISATPRTTQVSDCSAAIGKLGGSDYRGGHLIGLQLGGYGLRANLAPQHFNFNSGNWLQIENAAAKCQNLYSINVFGRRGTAYYDTKVFYTSGSTDKPYEFQVKITTVRPGFTSDEVDQTEGAFDNVAYGGANGTATRQRIVSDLADDGCL